MGYLNVRIRDDQAEDLRGLGWGQKTKIFEVICDDLIRLMKDPHWSITLGLILNKHASILSGYDPVNMGIGVPPTDDTDDDNDE